MMKLKKLLYVCLLICLFTSLVEQNTYYATSSDASVGGIIEEITTSPSETNGPTSLVSSTSTSNNTVESIQTENSTTQTTIDSGEDKETNSSTISTSQDTTDVTGLTDSNNSSSNTTNDSSDSSSTSSSSSTNDTDETTSQSSSESSTTDTSEDELLETENDSNNLLLPDEDMDNNLLTPNELEPLITRVDDASYGDFELVLPTNQYIVNGENLGDGVTSNMNAIIYIKLDNANIQQSFNYLVVVHDSTGEVIQSKPLTFKLEHYMAEIGNGPFFVAKFEGIAPGTIVTIDDIAISGSLRNSWGDKDTWNSASVGVVLSNIFAGDEDISDEVSVIEASSNPITLSQGEMRTMKFIRGSTSIPEDMYYQTPSDLTFDSIGNHYSNGFSGYNHLDKLLNSINVFSFNDIEGTHIVGPIIAQDSAYYKRSTPVSENKSNEDLDFSDYSRGTPSYVGNITARGDHGRDLAANYTYDTKKTGAGFKAPLFYTSTSTKLIKEGKDSWLPEFVYIPDAGIPPFMSPNNSGYTPVHHNDNYFDFARYSSGIMNECEKLITDGTIENKKMIHKTFDSRTDGNVLNVNPGESWNVINADNLTQINIIEPPGKDYFTDSKIDPLTINFTCSTINPTVMGGKSVSQFPLVTINGKEFENDAFGETIEFNEFGNKTIFNLPYVVTDENGNNRVVTLNTSQNIPGHVLMPQAEFWNYHEDTHGALIWEGGNLNGLLLAKDVHVGETEMHMWPYNGKEEQHASYILNATKTVNGLIPYDTFEFELNYVSGDKSGLYTSDFPIVGTSDTNGDIQFQSLIFTKEGEYRFNVKEINPNMAGMTYDQSEYELIVNVTTRTNGELTTLVTSGTFLKIKNNLGVLLDPAESVNNVHFNNTSSSSILPDTGGIGSNYFKNLGIILILLAGVLIIIKSNKYMEGKL